MNLAVTVRRGPKQLHNPRAKFRPRIFGGAQATEESKVTLGRERKIFQMVNAQITEKLIGTSGRASKKFQVRGAQATGSGGVPRGTSELHGAQATKQMDFLISRLGFTLLELMISISMLVIIIVIISSVMRLASRSVDAGERKVEALERLTTSLSIINAQIQSAAPWTYSDTGLSTQASQGSPKTQPTQPGQAVQGTQTAQPGQSPQSAQTAQGTQGSQNVQGAPKFYFKGDRRSLQFSTNYSVWGGQKGYVIVTYKVEPDLRTGKQSLFASEHMVGIEASRQTKLLDGFDDIAFSYFQNGLTIGEPGTWAQDWTSETTIPTKIRLYLLNGSKERLMVLPIRAKPLTGGA